MRYRLNCLLIAKTCLDDYFPDGKLIAHRFCPLLETRRHLNVIFVIIRSVCPFEAWERASGFTSSKNRWTSTRFRLLWSMSTCINIRLVDTCAAQQQGTRFQEGLTRLFAFFFHHAFHWPDWKLLEIFEFLLCTHLHYHVQLLFER